MNENEKKLVNELIRIITLANSRGCFKLDEASYIHKVVVTIQKEMDRLSPIDEEDVVMEDEEKNEI